MDFCSLLLQAATLLNSILGLISLWSVTLGLSLWEVITPAPCFAARAPLLSLA